MAENPKLESSDILSLSREACESDEMCSQKISVSDPTNSLQFTNIKSDSFMVDVESLSPLTDKDITANSRFKLQRSFSRKGSQQRGSEKNINSSNANEKETNIISSASPRAAIARASMPEKPMVVTVGPMDHLMNPQVHHQITIVTGNIGTTTAESMWMARRFGLRRSPPSWTINPRRILFFFATLSSMGTILLIYFTLSMGKHSGDDSALNL